MSTARVSSPETPVPRDERRPLLLVDIDGVLNPMGSGDDKRFVSYELHGYQVRLCQDHGKLLNELDREGQVELCWATTWNENANHDVGPAIGVTRPLPILPIDRALAGPVPFGTNWKTPSVIEGVGNRACAWIDDWIGADEQQWAETRILAGIPTLLVRTDPMVGLVPEHVNQVRSWVSQTMTPATPSVADLLASTPELSDDPDAMRYAQLFEQIAGALPETVQGTSGALTREDLVTDLWRRCAGTICADHRRGADQGGSALELVKQAVRRFLRGDGDAANAWADLAALHAAQPRDEVDPQLATGYRLVVTASPQPSAPRTVAFTACQMQQMIIAAAAEVGVHPGVYRAHRSIYFDESSSLVQIKIREDRRGVVTVSFGHDGRAERIPLGELLRADPAEILGRVMDVHATQLGTEATRGEYLHAGVIQTLRREGQLPLDTSSEVVANHSSQVAAAAFASPPSSGVAPMVSSLANAVPASTIHGESHIPRR